MRTSSRGGRRRGRPGGLAPGVLSGTVCGLLLLNRGLVVALVMDAFPRLNLQALGAVSLLVTLSAPHKSLVVIVPTVRRCFHTGSFDTLAYVVLVSSTFMRLGPRNSQRPSITPFFGLSTFSTAGLKYSLLP